MSMRVVALYAAVLAISFVALSLRTILLRRRLKIAIGDGGNPILQRAIRTHGNFAEYVPFTLLLLFLVASTGARPLYLHVLGGTLVAGRLLHVWAVTRDPEPIPVRTAGVALTMTPIVAAATRLLLFAVHRH
jgi:uncharacterized membrane protein YecN with MAPEG domain